MTFFNKGKTVPLNPEVKEELKDEKAGIFEPDGDLINEKFAKNRLRRS